MLHTPRPRLPPWQDPEVIARHEIRWLDDRHDYYLATVAPNMEWKARRQLMRRDIAVFLPECWESHRHLTPRLRRLSPRRAALFPGYLFLCFALPDIRMELFDETEARLMYRDDRLVKLPRSWIMDLRVIANAWDGPIRLSLDAKGRLVIPPEPPRHPNAWGRLFKDGDRLKLTEGPLAGFEGILKAEIRERVRILLDILGETREIEVQKEFVVVA